MELRVPGCLSPYLGLLSAERTGMCPHTQHMFTYFNGWEIRHSVEAGAMFSLPTHLLTIYGDWFPPRLVRNVRMSMCRQLSSHYTDFIFSGTEYTPNRETAGWHSSSNCSLLKIPRTVFHKGCMTESLQQLLSAPSQSVAVLSFRRQLFEQTWDDISRLYWLAEPHWLGHWVLFSFDKCIQAWFSQTYKLWEKFPRPFRAFTEIRVIKSTLTSEAWKEQWVFQWKRLKATSEASIHVCKATLWGLRWRGRTAQTGQGQKGMYPVWEANKKLRIYYKT